ncbi:MAG: hypothetical protein ACOYN0_13880 [Phycisphaerales bacterium]
MDKKPTPMEFLELANRHRALDNERAAAVGQLKSAEARLEEAKTKARDQFGTDDLPALRTKLEEMRAENLRKRAEYQALLDGIEAKLAEINSNYAQAAGGKA